jgi:formylglycine-generating enzyme required for sulfatase activity
VLDVLVIKSVFMELPAGDHSIGIDTAKAESVEKALITKVDKSYLSNSIPRHIVRFANPVFISRRHVTLSEFDFFIGDTGYVTEAEMEGWGWIWKKKWEKILGVSWKNPFSDDADVIYRGSGEIFPVLQTSWNDAVKYCEWFAQKNGLGARLPSESEWEIFSTVAGGRRIEDIILEPAAENKLDSCKYLDRIKNSVESSEITPVGLLWEWTLDWFDSYPGGAANREFGKVYKVLRGGSVLSEPYQRAMEYRFRRCPTARSPYYGFRVAVTAPA